MNGYDEVMAVCKFHLLLLPLQYNVYYNINTHFQRIVVLYSHVLDEYQATLSYPNICAVFIGA